MNCQTNFLFLLMLFYPCHFLVIPVNILNYWKNVEFHKVTFVEYLQVATGQLVRT